MTRTQISLDGEWEFYIDPQGRLTPESLAGADGRRTIRVPGPWQAQFADLRDYAGVAWYRRNLDLEPAAPGQAAYLCFGAVDYHATVWLNGQLLGEHEGGYLPFELRADAALRPGRNELVLRVIDPGFDSARTPGYPFAEIPHGKQSWYGPIGGIWQSVRLELRPELHLTRLQITPDVPGERAMVLVQLSAAAATPLALRLRLSDPRGRLDEHQAAIVAGADHVRVELPIPDPLLWDIGQPQLYSLEAALMPAAGSGAALDILSDSFGMRTIATSPDGKLLLNGRPIYLRGALDQDYYPDLIYTPFSDAELDEQFAKAHHMGLNCLRTHIKITDPRYYYAADRAGILIWTELPNWELLTEETKRRAKATLEGMVARDWNHPSIIIWTIINEGWGVDLAGQADHRAWLAESYAYLKQLDPHRLVVGNSPCFGNFHVVSDIEDFHNYYAIPDHYQQWRAWVQSFGGRAAWSYAHKLDTYSDWRRYERNPWGEWERTVANEVQRGHGEPLIVSEFGNWGLPDLAKLYECYGGEPWWFETGMEWGSGVVYPHGVEARFRTYHLDKAFGSLPRLIAASQHMQWVALKEEIEQMRRQPSIVGYVITEFTDVHWESNGLLDMCRNPKASYDIIGSINADDVLVPIWERSAYRSGEQVAFAVELSHFSERDLRDARLEWWVDAWPDLRGTATVQASPAGLAPAGVVSFTVPELTAPARIRVELRLYDAANDLAATNYQELYAFPRAATPPQAPIFVPDAALAAALAGLGYRVVPGLDAAALVVTSVLDDELNRFARAGGRVLLLAEQGRALRTRLPQTTIERRRGRSWQGDWASSLSWVRPDTAGAAIPSAGLVDFAFADLTPEYVIGGLQAREFADRVHAGLTVGWLHDTVATIAERPIGRGRVLISTFRLCDKLAAHPVAQELLRSLVGLLE